MRGFRVFSRRVLAAVVATALAIGLMPLPAFAQAGTLVAGGMDAGLAGDGSAERPFLIGSYGELGAFAKRVNARDGGYAGAYAKLTTDVSIPASAAIDPIGSGDAPFTGVFDGAGHTVTLAYRSATTYALFGGLEGATVKNLTVDGYTVAASGLAGAREVRGGTFAGVLDASATFENCVNKATVIGTAKGVGGFASLVEGRAPGAVVTFDHCVNDGAVVGRAADGSGVDSVGGLVGRACTSDEGGGDVSLSFNACVNRGQVASETGMSAGGLLGGAVCSGGSASQGKVGIELSGAGNQGSVSAAAGAGGLVGAVSGARKLALENVYNTGSVSVCAGELEGFGLTGGVGGGLVAAADSGSGSASSALSVRNAYNAGAVACSADDSASVDPVVLGGVFGGLSFDPANATLANVHYSLDRSLAAIGKDLGGGNWGDGVVGELDDMMLDASFVQVLGAGFIVDDGENRGFPVLSATKTELAPGAFTATTEQASYPWNNGLEVRANVVVSPKADPAKKLVRDVDYTVFYEDNVNAGTATATVVGVGAYYGSLTVPFTINGYDIGSCRIAAIDEQVYTGKAIAPAITVTGAKKGAAYTLVPDVDYTVSYSNNVNDGYASVLVKGRGQWAGAKMARFRIWKPFFTVNVVDSTGRSRVAKRYTRLEFEALADMSGAPVSALFNGHAGSWRVTTAKSYVTFERLFADAGVAWGAGSGVAYVAGDDAEKASRVTYERLNDLYFYPWATSGAIDVGSEEGRKTPPVLAIEAKSNNVGENDCADAGAVEAYNLENADTETEPRVLMGISRDDAANPDSPDANVAGSRLIKNLDQITVFTSANPMTAKVKAKTQVVAYNAKKATRLAAKDLFSVAKAQGAVAYSKASGDKRISVAKNGDVTVAAGMPTGKHALKVKVSAAGKGGYEPVSKTLEVTVQVKKANTLNVKAKAPTVKFNAKKAQTVAAKDLFSVAKPQGAVSYTKAGGDAKLSISKAGVVTVAKGTKRGTHSIKVSVTAAGNATYAPVTKQVTVRVQVK